MTKTETREMGIELPNELGVWRGHGDVWIVFRSANNRLEASRVADGGYRETWYVESTNFPRGGWLKATAATPAPAVDVEAAAKEIIECIDFGELSPTHIRRLLSPGESKSLSESAALALAQQRVAEGHVEEIAAILRKHFRSPAPEGELIGVKKGSLILALATCAGTLEALWASEHDGTALCDDMKNGIKEALELARPIIKQAAAAQPVSPASPADIQAQRQSAFDSEIQHGNDGTRHTHVSPAEQGDGGELQSLRDELARMRDTDAIQDRQALLENNSALEAEIVKLRLRLLSAAGDDLCRLTQEEIKAYTSGEVQIPPKEEFLASCERFHQQIAAGPGVLSGCLTLAQLIAENERLREQLAAAVKRLEERPAIRRIIIDPSGYVAIEFDTFDDRADFCDWIPSGQVYGDTRHNTEGPPWRITWKLSDFAMPFHLELTDEKRKLRTALREAAIKRQLAAKGETNGA